MSAALSSDGELAARAVILEGKLRAEHAHLGALRRELAGWAREHDRETWDAPEPLRSQILDAAERAEVTAGEIDAIRDDLARRILARS